MEERIEMLESALRDVIAAHARWRAAEQAEVAQRKAEPKLGTFPTVREFVMAEVAAQEWKSELCRTQEANRAAFSALQECISDAMRSGIPTRSYFDVDVDGVRHTVRIDGYMPQDLTVIAQESRASEAR